MADEPQLISTATKSKKREIMTGELREKLSCKYDYIKYFKEARKFSPTFNPELCSVALCAAQHHGKQGLLEGRLHGRERLAQAL